MAGKRRGDPGGLVPTLRATRHARRRRSMAGKLAAAPDAKGRLQVASDYLRGAAARRQRDQERADFLLDQISQRMVALGDDLLEQQGQEPILVRWPT